MNEEQKEKVTRGLNTEPTYPLKDWEAGLLAGLKSKHWDREISPEQEVKLNEVMRKFT